MRQPVPFFLSYAHSDAGDVDRFRAAFQPLLKSAAPYEFGGWMDRQILPGERWRTEIDEALLHARFGLLFLSPDFLASAFITQNELPRCSQRRWWFRSNYSAFCLTARSI